MQTLAITNSFADKINAKYQEGRDLALQSGLLAIQCANALRETGIFLATAKENMGQAEFVQLVASLNIEGPKEKRIGLLLTIAARNHEPFKTTHQVQREFEDLMRAAGELEFPSGHGKQKIHGVDLMAWLSKAATNFRSELKKKYDEDPIEKWEPFEARQFAVQIKPTLDDLSRIFEAATKRGDE